MASRSDVRIFTIREANETLKQLRKTLPAMRRVLHDIEKMEDRLEVLDLICDRAVSSENPDLRQFLSAKILYHRKIAEFEGMLAGLESQGLLLRDLAKGVVHFPARHEKRDILLCWAEGETDISHWHPLQAGAVDESRRQRLRPTEKESGC